MQGREDYPPPYPLSPDGHLLCPQTPCSLYMEWSDQVYHTNFTLSLFPWQGGLTIKLHTRLQVILDPAIHIRHARGLHEKQQYCSHQNHIHGSISVLFTVHDIAIVKNTTLAVFQCYLLGVVCRCLSKTVTEPCPDRHIALSWPRGSLEAVNTVPEGMTADTVEESLSLLLLINREHATVQRLSGLKLAILSWQLSRE